MSETKEFWKSKLFWIGILQLAIAAASYAEGNVAQGLPITMTGLLTVITRFATTQAIK